MNRIIVTADNRERIRKYYFSLCEQGKANFLYDNEIGGASLNLSPNDYPKATAMHRICDCGSNPRCEHIATFDKHDTYVICPNCGAKTVKEVTPFWAWKAWDHKKLEAKDNNLTIWEML